MRGRIGATLGIVIVLCVGNARKSCAQTKPTSEWQDSFRFTLRTPMGYAPVPLGNGYLTVATSWNGCGPAPATVT